MSEIMKIIDERNKQQTNKQTNKQTITKKNKLEGRYSKRIRAKWFCWAVKLGLLQLICKASLMFKSNLELALSIILKERELYESKHVVVECRCIKIWALISFLIFSLIIVLKC